MKQEIDLHVHSTASDGTFSPEELVSYALSRHLRAIALTDHDTTAGLALIREAAAGTSLEIVNGIEFSTVYQNTDVHIVGLDIDPANPAFQSRLEHFQHSRDIRNEQILQLMQQDGIAVSMEALHQKFGEDVVLTRAHFARFLTEAGYASTLADAFQTFLSPGCPYYVKRRKITPKDAVELIFSTGGIPVLAHPMLYSFSEEELTALILSLKECGLIGIEALYSTHSAAEEAFVTNLAERLHLCISGGSDFHGANKPGLDLGSGYGMLSIPYELLDRLRERRNHYER